MKKIVLILLIIHSSLIITKSQWVIQYTSNYSCQLNSIKFTDLNTGYIVGEDVTTPYGKIYKTTNGGNNWFMLTLPGFMNTLLWELDFLNSYTGYVSGHSFNIFKTTDGGYNWSFTTAPYNSPAQAYSAIKFFDEQTGYIGGSDGMIAKTTNSGINWSSPDTAYADVLDFYFFNENTGFFVDVYHGIYKTTNSCNSWTYWNIYDTATMQYGYALEKIKFINQSTGYIVGARTNPSRGALFKTTNGGNNWKSIYIVPENSFYSLEIINDSIIYIGSHNKIIYKSINAGKNWTAQQLPSYWAGYNSIEFINENTGLYCCGNEILRTTNGGVFVKQISSKIPDECRLFQNYPNPFNHITNIKYQITKIEVLPQAGQNSEVRIIVYDLIGKEINTLLNEKQSPGTYEVKFYDEVLSSGLYFYSLSVDGKLIDTKKLILIK